MKNFKFLFLLSVLFMGCKSTQETIAVKDNEQKDSITQIHAQPKLVVGIVVDQMRYDYITRFWNRFGENGIKRLVNDGYNCKNNHFNYVPTYTGPGHASVYTGTTPKNHGIIGNNWYDKFEDLGVYCAGDSNVDPVGTNSSAGKMSPHRMLTTTFADQNRLHTQFKGKTIGISVKDRGAILPAGHTANAAYWFHGKEEGKFISSSYYLEDLPSWVKDFNSKKYADSYLTTWETLYPIETYMESGADQNNFEHGFKGKETATFPYNLAELSIENGNYDIIKSTPFGNSITTDFALAALIGENLGKDEITDVLTVSFSCTDYVGHNFGVNSKEVEDTYLRLDQDIARILEALDTQVGKGEYTVFLTSDHGAVNVPAYLKSHRVPAGYFDNSAFKNAIDNFIGEEYGVTDLIADNSNNQFFFNHERLKEENISAEDLANNLKSFMLTYEHVDKVFTRETLENSSFSNGVEALVQNGFSQKRSGDMVVVFDPAYIAYPEKGSTHGSAMSYDTHAPLIFFGNGIKNGQTTERTEIIDIAPTISALLGISFPNGMTGKVLHKIIDQEN
ncbi:Predicted pyrophosphatase or phosphodiesterase, AlkP superfamily [Mesonia phycicola]|uniref:Predicted pyrophosphatase or phosphodiesterase, AlkP superfamily n=1 Tax=Mesonia phycicola TaxID=579105 RepID=A0A1M6H4Y6_9FLAO|nr:alkaline phosphatase PafA [Mesonia phycicola]SHJ17226.1 Predicted pyrophosphatase or phosphodiesterase, AlkP superfamily [Mesonia phycicola]